MATTPKRTKPPGTPERPPIPGKTKPAKAETITRVKAASGGKYKTDAEVRAVIAKITVTADPLAAVFDNLGIRV